jgi:hypothetical protein
MSDPTLSFRSSTACRPDGRELINDDRTTESRNPARIDGCPFGDVPGRRRTTNADASGAGGRTGAATNAADPRSQYAWLRHRQELPDGALPPTDADGNFIVGPTHNPAPEMTVQDGVPQGTIYNLTMSSADSKIYPGIARDAGTFGTVDPTDPAKLVVTTSHPAPYTRRVAVYVPKQYVPGTAAPFIVGADGPDQLLFTALDNLIAQKRVPPMIAISIGNGSGDAQGSQRGLEYDTMSGRYAEFIESEVLPVVEKQYNVTLTKDPEGATTGGSSGGSAALIMAWYHPALSPRADLLGHLCEPAVAAELRDAARRVGIPRTPHSEQPGQADSNLDGGRGPRPAQSECHAGQHARLGRRERKHGEGARRQGLSLPVRVREERRAHRQSSSRRCHKRWNGCGRGIQSGVGSDATI